MFDQYMTVCKSPSWLTLGIFLVSPTVPGPCDPEDLIDGIIFAANYLGSTQLLSDKTPSKNVRMMQAQEAVSRIKVSGERLYSLQLRVQKLSELVCAPALSSLISAKHQNTIFSMKWKWK